MISIPQKNFWDFLKEEGYSKKAFEKLFWYEIEGNNDVEIVSPFFIEDPYFMFILREEGMKYEYYKVIVIDVENYVISSKLLFYEEKNDESFYAFKIVKVVETDKAVNLAILVKTAKMAEVFRKSFFKGEPL